MDVEEALGQVGGRAPWHMTMFVCLSFSMFIPLCFQSINIVFLGYEPPHHCKVPGNSTFNATIPHSLANGLLVPDKCSMYQRSTASNVTIACTDGWTYDSGGFTSIVTEWDLVCDNNYLAEASQVLYQVSCMVGGFIMSYLCDRYGRKPVFVVCNLLSVVAGIAVALSVNFIMFIVMRAVTGFFAVGSVAAGVALVMELFDADTRAMAGIGMEFPWVIIYCALALFAYLITNWRYLQLLLALLSVGSVLYIWVLPESVPWLAATGKYHKAEKILMKMAKWNRRQVKPIKLQKETNNQLLSDKATENGGSNKNATAKDVTLADILILVTDSRLRRHMIMSTALWFTNCVIYYYQILSSPALAGNRFINFFIMGIVELPAYFLSLFVIDRFGRRISTCVSHIGAAAPLVPVVFMPMETKSGVDLSPLSTTLVMISKFCISVSFAVFILYQRELFPTKIRATACGISSIAGRIGSMLAPVAAYAAKTHLPWLPNLVIAILSLCVGLLTLLLPETAGKPMPLTVDDVELLYRPAPNKLKYRADVHEQRVELKAKTDIQ